MPMMCAIAALALLACGGGDATSSAVDVNSSSNISPTGAAIAGVGNATILQTRDTPATDSASWAPCAGENGWCAFSGTRLVRYGAGSAVVEKSMTDGVSCNNGVFGDPIVGVVKQCWLQALATTTNTWVSCAQENGICNFSGLIPVRYGAAEHFVTRELPSPVDCSNATFGDPIVGVVKSCSYAEPQIVSPAADACELIPALPTLPASYNLVTAFCVNGYCAKPDDGVDDTDAIDAALDQSAGKFLVFPPGTYQIRRSLRIKKPGVTLWGPGATIHATNWDDQSIIVEANDTSIYSFRLTAVTAQRGSRAEHTRIAIYGPAGVNPVVKNTVIRDNRIVNAGNPGTNLANAATGAGIFVNAADGFLIAGNTVARTLADGIHLTGGARNGRVLANTVLETGDDMIAAVSYAYPDPVNNTVATIVADFASNLESRQDRNILIANNQLSGQYWGRGIAVVGGRDITIRGNTLSNIPYGAAVLLARESQSGTYGLNNVLVEKNVISDVQTMSPPYDFGGKFAQNARTGHGAIEVHGSMFVDELGVAAVASGMAMTRITVQDNTITHSATPGLRIGVGNGTLWNMGPRAVNGSAPLSNLVLNRNILGDVRINPALQMIAAPGTTACSGNTLNGSAMIANCSAALTTVASGAALTCIKP